MLIKASPEAKQDLAAMRELIHSLDKRFMSLHSDESITFADAALIGPYDFAVLFSGTHAAAIHLSTMIAGQGRGQFETLTMPAIALDQFLSISEG